MENIILQIVQEKSKKIIEYFQSHGVCGINQMAEELKRLSEEMALEMLTAFIGCADEAICEAKAQRKSDGIKVHERRVPRTTFTVLGEMTYQRTYFDMPNGERKYILDDVIEVAPYERIDSGISAKLVNTAAMYSFGRSADIVTGGQISRQSVRNKIMNTGEVLHIPAKAKKPPEALHIFADEDHVHLQRGGNAIIPLITVCEGKRRLSEGRNELIEAFHVQGYGIKPENFWEYVYALCAEKYDIEHLGKIYIYGDGASWILTGFDYFTSAMHILDEFHFKKRLKKLLAGEICASYAGVIHRVISDNDPARFEKIIDKMLLAVNEKLPEGKVRTGRIKALNDNSKYIRKFWEAIQNMKTPDSIGSCTEAMVSHVLSERFSRSPMGWSKQGLSKTSMIRVFVLNGGKIQPTDTLAWKKYSNKNSVITTHKKYEAIIKAQHDKLFKDVNSWRWFETESQISGKTTGTSVALDALGRMRNVS